ncbi:MAG: aminopeptidase [Candidatus Aenigmarchaeota archaeon]|nr:aminopeptidase [Candidatus Aenigmarchaeota archaeon]
MQPGINTLLRECLSINPLEKVLILTDNKISKIGRKVYEACRKINLESCLMVMEARTKEDEELPMHVSNAMRASDVVIAITSHSILYTKATKIASEKGVRIANLVRVSEKTFTKGGLTASYSRVSREVEKLFKKVDNSNFVEISSSNGTNVYFSTRERKWYKETGILRAPGKIGNLPGGEVYVAPVENSINGKIVIDEFGEFGKKVSLEIENGRIVKVSKASKKFKELLEKYGEEFYICEFGIGCNYKVRFTGNIHEDKKVSGSIHFGFGYNLSFGGIINLPFHFDGIIKKASVKVDNRIIIERGKLII